jgi:hypothetical protein
MGSHAAKFARARGVTRSYVGYLDSGKAAAEFSTHYLAQARCSN